MINNKTRHIQRLTQLLVLSMLCLLGSCSSGEEQEPTNWGKTNCKVRLYVNVNDRNPRMGDTRASNQDDSQWDTPGSGFENRLDIDDFRLYLFSAEDDKLIAHLTDPETSKNIELSFDRTNNDGTLYQIEFCVDDIVKNVENNLKTFKLVMLANWGKKYPSDLKEEGSSNFQVGVTTIADLTSEFDECIGENFNPCDPLTKIPFFGVQECTEVNLQSNTVVEIKEKLLLLRALAKIEVYDPNPSEAAYELKDVKLHRYNTKFYKAPLGVTESEQYTGKKTSLSIPDQENSEIDLTVDFKKNSNGHYIIYVPEYKNIANYTQNTGRDDKERSSIIVRYDDDKEYTIDFKYYQADPVENGKVGDFYDLHRNYWYEIKVTRGWKLEVQADVIPFSVVDLTPDFGLDRDPVTGFLKGKDSDGKVCWYDVNYYEDAEGKTDAKPLYLGTSENPGKTVDVSGKQYMLVYADGYDYDKPIYAVNDKGEQQPQVTGYQEISGFERRASTLSMIIDIADNKRYILTPEAITGYAYGNDMYLNDLKQRVWLDGNLFPNPPSNENITPPAYILRSHRIIFEWDRLDWNKAYWWRWPGVYPKYWFDVFGNRYSWEEGDTWEKREAILGDWAQYLR